MCLHADLKRPMLAALTLAFLAIAPHQASADEPAAGDPITLQAAPQRPDSPAMQMPAHLRNVPPVRHPVRSGEPPAFPADAGSVDHYDAVSKTVTRRSGTQRLAALSAEPGNQTQSGLPSQAPVEESAARLATILGTDGRTRINNTEVFPYRAIAKLVISTANGLTGCSGTLVPQGTSNAHSFHVLTAGHCVNHPDFGGNSWATSVQVFPALDDGYMPFNMAVSTKFRSYTSWVVDRNDAFDMALITLDREVGNFTGFMERDTGLPGHSMYTNVLNTAGYPGDKGGDQMWFDADYGRYADEERHWYYMDTVGGQSGSPVWRFDGATNHILTIHAYGDDGTGSNHGTRLKPSRISDIEDWTAEDPLPQNRADLIDLGPSAADISPNTALRGITTLTITHGIRNVGTAASGAFCVSYYLSPDAALSFYDHLIGQRCGLSLTPFTSISSTFSTVVPTTVPPGTYFVGWRLDSSHTVFEFDENNNGAVETQEQLVIRR